MVIRPKVLEQTLFYCPFLSAISYAYVSMGCKNNPYGMGRKGENHDLKVIQKTLVFMILKKICPC